ncbi:putative DNA-binding domain-containing protein [Ramlibacter sp.]|uniref:HvfC/BufC family peptide modification chaperone n=1 Tax=Ramlibacter sp. TaxID=1917967 RepID=UPI0035B49940
MTAALVRAAATPESTVAGALAAQQQALVAALWARGPQEALALAAAHLVPEATTLRGLRAYRSNGRALAVRALAAAYPSVAALLGEDNFEAVAQAVWLAHPPVRGDMAEWGGDLPAWIASRADLAQAEPYLADVARVDWALHVAASAADAEPDLASLALLQQHDPDTLTLVLAPGTQVIESPWPVVSLVQAHAGDGVSLDEAAARLRAGEAEPALVWREGLRPRVRVAASGEAAFGRALQAGGSLAQALDAAPAFDFAAWLSPAVATGLLTGAALMNPMERSP